MFKRRRSTPQPLTILSAKSEIQGDLFVEGNLRVEGIIHGRVEVRGNVEVLASGLIEGAEIRATSLTNYGIVKAKVELSGTLYLGAQAQLEGDVTAKALNVEAGARYVGYATTTAPEIPTMALPAASPVQEFIPQKKQQPEIILGENKVLR
ncbi:MAG: bactofilin family protein [Prochlorothrix sp.]|nr:polymer-forming cytoskeletal protein [Prochlorothrix sp.]